MKPAVKALLDQIANEVGTLDSIAVREIAPILASAEREVANDLARWLATAPNGNARFTAFQLRRVLAQLRATLDELKRIDPQVYATLRRASVTGGALAVRHVTESLSRFATRFAGSLNPIALNTAAIMAKGDKMLIPRHRTSAARYVGQVRDDIRRQLSLGMLRGETIDEMTARLARAGGPRGLVYTRGMAGDPRARAEIISEGLFRRYRHWGERLVRTEVIGAYNIQADVAIAKAKDADDGIMRMWNAANDRRVCLECRYLDRKVTGVGQPFPGGYMSAPAHPHCRCSVVAWHRAWG
jgi:hypothetical protein